MAKKSSIIAPDQGDFLFYTAPDGTVKAQALISGETVWLPLESIAELFGVEVSVIATHMQSLLDSGELEKSTVTSSYEMADVDGKSSIRQLYNLNAIISIGYMVDSYQATQFRQWATGILCDYLTKGFALDDERLKQGGAIFGKDYFKDLLERIRDIRASERRFYQKVTDIYALSADYDKDAPLAKEFFATVQHKLHWAITGRTAAEQIYISADASMHNMGLTNWKNAPDGKINKADVSVAKNYLSESHLQELNRIVSAFLDLAEVRAKQGTLMKMKDWASYLDRFLDISNYPILADGGRVSDLEAKLKAESEYERFRQLQDAEYVSDFDHAIENMQRLQSTAKQEGQYPEQGEE